MTLLTTAPPSSNYYTYLVALLYSVPDRYDVALSVVVSIVVELSAVLCALLNTSRAKVNSFLVCRNKNVLISLVSNIGPAPIKSLTSIRHI